MLFVLCPFEAVYIFPSDIRNLLKLSFNHTELIAALVSFQTAFPRSYRHGGINLILRFSLSIKRFDAYT